MGLFIWMWLKRIYPRLVCGLGVLSLTFCESDTFYKNGSNCVNMYINGFLLYEPFVKVNDRYSICQFVKRKYDAQRTGHARPALAMSGSILGSVFETPPKAEPTETLKPAAGQISQRAHFSCQQPSSSCYTATRYPSVVIGRTNHGNFCL